MKRGFLFFVILFVFTTALFWQGIFTFFVQDDFFLLSISRATTRNEFFTFFIPLSQVPWYRPLSSQVFFFLERFFFGLNPVWYHITVLVTHFLTTFFVFKFAQKILTSKTVSYLSAVVYASSWIHVISLSWLAAYSFVLGPFFLITALIAYHDKKYILSCLLFFPGLLSSEVLVIFPVIIFMHQLLFEKKLSLFKLSPFVVSSMILIFIRYVFFPSANNTNLYSFNFSFRLFLTLKFYIFRLLGLPMVTEIMPQTLKIIVCTLFLFSTVFLIRAAFLCMKDLKRKELIFLFLVGCLGLVPFLPLSFHVSPHYLSFSLPGFAPFLGYLIAKPFRYSMIVLLPFILLQVISVNWTYQTHWIFERADLAKDLVQKKSLIHPVGSEEYFSLGANKAAEAFK